MAAMRNVLIGLLAAAGLALALSGASIAGIAAWKIVLAAIGFAVFVSGRPRSAPRP
jgi:hypothetical protein